jgi:hypothetical protein
LYWIHVLQLLLLLQPPFAWVVEVELLLLLL